MNDSQIKIIKALEIGLPVTETPFDEIAARAGVTVDALIKQINKWKTDGTIRRFGAILRHHQAGYKANAMAVWNVPEVKIEAFAEVAISFKNVSHCYQRPRFDGFDYNLYTMIHGKSDAELTQTAREISETTGISDYKLLRTVAEYKKSSPVYFANAEVHLHTSHLARKEREHCNSTPSVSPCESCTSTNRPKERETKGGAS